MKNNILVVLEISVRMATGSAGGREDNTAIPWTLIRVSANTLDPTKHWYVLTKELCGYKPSKFARHDIFKKFPAEIAIVATKDLRHLSTDASHIRLPATEKSIVVSSFGICCGLLKRNDYPADGFIHSTIFERVISQINAIVLDDQGTCDFGAQIDTEDGSWLRDELFRSRKRIEELEDNTRIQQRRIRELESLLDDFRRSPSNTIDLDDSGIASDINTCIETLKNSPIGPIVKKRQIQSICRKVMADLQDVSEKYRETLGTVLGSHFVFGNDEDKDDVRDIISEILDIVLEAEYTKKPLAEIIHPETYNKVVELMRVPDWVLLYFKIHSKLPDTAWQTLLNLTQLGSGSRQSSATPILLSQNKIRAIRRHVFAIIRRVFSIESIEAEFKATCLDLKSAIVWTVREQRLYWDPQEILEFNIKLDGRPLGGKNQVAVGIVPMQSNLQSTESCLSVLPIAIGNCKENRKNLTQLIKTLNTQKNDIKKHGLTIDGKHYKFKFTVTLDYKALLLLICKNDDEDFILGGKGYDVEFCVFCDAIRACTKSHGGDTDDEEVCLDCLRSKANIGRNDGIRDDLTFLLEEDLSHINLCSLHCEMRNLEQILGAIGLFAYRADSLDDLNHALASYGPEVQKDLPRITTKEKPGQQTGFDKCNIKVASFSGSTERAILNNIETVVRQGLPFQKVFSYFNSSQRTAKEMCLDFLTFTEERLQYIGEILAKGTYKRDYGTKEDLRLVQINPSGNFYKYLKELERYWSEKQTWIATKYKELSKKKKVGSKSSSHTELAAELQIEFIVKVCTQWKDIAETLRKDVFEENEEGETRIDIFDVKCKEWGFLLRKVFGNHLGTGDYGHLVIDHSAMLMRQFRSLYHYSTQGFESSHKLHRQLYSRTTNHDRFGPGDSLDQILTHWYATHMLSMRYKFRQAVECLNAGKTKVQYIGARRSIQPDICNWNEDKKKWLIAVDNLFTEQFGDDFLRYTYDKDKGMYVDEDIISKLSKYDHESWEEDFERHISEDIKCSTPLKKRRKRKHQSEKLMPNKSSTGPTKEMIESDDELELSSTPVSKKQDSIDENQPSITIQHTGDDVSSISIDSSDSDDQATTEVKKQEKTLKDTINTSKTRSELASLKRMVPPVQHRLSVSRVCTSSRNVPLSDPFTLGVRPRLSVVEKAQEVMKKMKVKSITIRGLGTFDEKGLAVFKKFCNILDTESKVSAEKNWLKQFNLTPNERTQLQNVLWHLPSNSSIMKHGNKCIDVLSLSTLIGERYIDNFVIDVLIGKIASSSQSTLYLPSEFCQWMQSTDKAFITGQLKNQMVNIHDPHSIIQLLVPVYMPKHWGLVCIHLQEKKLYFDDGLRINPPDMFILFIKEALNLLSEMFPSHPYLSSHFWSSKTDFERFGMPSQLTSNPNMIGSGSCGVGVIMSAEDFITKGAKAANNFKWNFGEMNIHRKNLMLRILLWQGSSN